MAATDVRQLLQNGVEWCDKEEHAVNYRFASRSGSQASIAAVFLNLGGKRCWVALQNVPCSSHAFLGVGNVVVAVVALALR